MGIVKASNTHLVEGIGANPTYTYKVRALYRATNNGQDVTFSNRTIIVQPL